MSGEGEGQGLAPPAVSTTLIGHNAVVADLERAWVSGRMHHALLLTGPKGIGKATLGYRVAKMVIAGTDDIGSALEHPIHGQLAGGAAQQFRLLERTPNKEGRLRKEIGVDDVRALAPFVRQRLDRGEWRVILIDAVDDLSISSANALLKMLEEPGERTLFILVAHAANVLPTIRSRCTPVRMQGLNEPDLRGALKLAGIHDGHIDTLVGIAGGSIGRALSLSSKDVVSALADLDMLLRGPEWGVQRASRIADIGAARDGDAAFAAIREGIGHIAYEHMRDIALREPSRAAGMVQVLASVEQNLTEREEYGVDRKTSLRTAMSEVHRALHGSSI